MKDSNQKAPFASENQALTCTPLREMDNVTVLPTRHRTRPFHEHPGYLQMRALQHYAQETRLPDPFFTVHDGPNGVTTEVNGQTLINFSSYNYLGLNGDQRVNRASIAAIKAHGSSVSASRLVSGERALHQQLERELANAHGCEAALTFVSGHATNVTVLGYLYGPDDLIVHDRLAHNSILQGIRLAGADRLSFKHNDLQDLQKKLGRVRHRYQNVLIVVEGLYSMDGDCPDLPALVALKNHWGCQLMVDDAHGLGVLGATGMGIGEHSGVDSQDIDIWMGTLSKTLASAGGYVAGSQALIDLLRFQAPGFLYSVGLPPPATAAALEALRILHAEPQRVAQLQAISRYFFDRAQALDIDTGTSQGHAILPVILGDPHVAVLASQAMAKQGVHVKPIIYPAVADQAARLRFFIGSQHTREMVDQTIEAWLTVYKQLPRIDGMG